ncbi:MAG: cupin domain-containing protein [Melioribacteraceae bacterium]|nr:cupin domain-containing protein [Melioribacteraceae bacterium]
MDSKDIIKKLELTPHPEGGYYKEVYRSNNNTKLIINTLPVNRSLATSIYFLLEKDQFSSFHKLKSDELWYHHTGSYVRIHVIDKKGNYFHKDIGTDLEKNIEPQFIIEAESWFAAELTDKNSYSLLGCMVTPGFDFADFELAEKEKLTEQFPQHNEIIAKFTRQ